jgi:hypothetical protein
MLLPLFVVLSLLNLQAKRGHVEVLITRGDWTSDESRKAGPSRCASGTGGGAAAWRCEMVAGGGNSWWG